MIPVNQKLSSFNSARLEKQKDGIMNKHPNRITQEAMKETEQGLGEIYPDVESMVLSWEDTEHRFLHTYKYVIWLELNYEDSTDTYWEPVPCESKGEVVQLLEQRKDWLQVVMTQPVAFQFTMEDFIRMND